MSVASADFRNAPVSALIYEFLYEVYKCIGWNRPFVDCSEEEFEAPLGVFDHTAMGKWEHCSGFLVKCGAMVPVARLVSTTPQTLKSRYGYDLYTPVMTLETCLTADFSAFENFENYCYAIFILDQVMDTDRDNEVDLLDLSPRFVEEIAAKDDCFELDGPSRVLFSYDRMTEKIESRYV